MDTILLSAIIGGFFSLIGIYVKHRLDKQNEISPTSNVENRDAAQYDSLGVLTKLFNSDLKKGLGLLVLDFVIIIIFVGVFDLNNKEPFWENIFAAIVLGVVPVYAIYLILKGFFRFFLD